MDWAEPLLVSRGVIEDGFGAGEVSPPQPAGDSNGQNRDGDQVGGHFLARDDPGGDDQGFAQRNDDEQAMPLGEVFRVQVPALLPSADACRDEVNHDGRNPEPVA